MKLADYAIRDALSRRDWPAAVAIMASHFRFVMPAEYRTVVFRNSYFFQVAIYFPQRSYSWGDTRGFSVWPRATTSPPLDAVEVWIR